MPSRTLSGALAALTALTAAGAVAVATGRDDQPRPGALATATGPDSRTQLSDPPRGDAATLLATLPVRTDPGPGGYDRDAFGSGWTDPDRNGCSTREDVLAADAAPDTITRGPDGCLTDGDILDPYTGTVIDPRTADIDHVVSLGDAWRSGAATWTPQRRESFAEDTANLLAVTDRVNAAKGDRAADTWLPPAAPAVCPFVAQQVSVKARYQLSVTGPERAAMRAALAGCPDQRVPGDR